MDIKNILYSRILRKSAINIESYCDYIKKIYLKEDIDIVNIHPELYIIDSNNFETFWVDSGEDGTIVFDLHLVDFLHFYSMIVFCMFNNNFNPKLCTGMWDYILANYYLTKGDVSESLFFFKKYNSEIDTNEVVSTISNLNPKLNFEIRLIRGVQIHFIILHEMAHIQFRKKNKDAGLIVAILNAVDKFNDYVNKVNTYNITEIEYLLLKHNDTPEFQRISHFMEEFDSLYNVNGQLDAGERHVIQAVAENYFKGSKLDPIHDNTIIEECYCDLFAIKAILDNFYFTADFLSIDNIELIIKSVICATTCIDIINTIKTDPVLKTSSVDLTLLRKEIFRPVLIKLILAYCSYGKWKRSPKDLVEHFLDISHFNELIYRVNIDYLIFLRDKEKPICAAELFSEKWYKIKDFIINNLSLPFSYV